MKRIDYKSGLLLAVATIQGAIFGALNTTYISRRVFNDAFGVLMIAATIVLFLYPYPRRAKEAIQNRRGYYLVRNLVEKDGTMHTFSYNLRVGVGLSFFVGYISSLFGIGGGRVYVPLLTVFVE